MAEGRGAKSGGKLDRGVDEKLVRCAMPAMAWSQRGGVFFVGPFFFPFLEMTAWPNGL